MDNFKKLNKINDSLSYVPCRMSACFGDNEIAIGTAFFYLYENQSYLVTNWHNVTGLEPETLKCKSSMGAIPDRIQLKIPYTGQDESKVHYLYWSSQSIALYEETAGSSEAPKPVWYEHPQYRHKVDVVAIPLSGIHTTQLKAANESTLNLSEIPLSPGLDVFVLGFPRGISGGGNLPIWKRGSIASEPDVDIDNLPKIFIDTATREGMSGSPVYAQRIGVWLPEDVDTPDGSVLHDKTIIGEGRRFIGIYSGRIGNDPFKAQLGIVWKPSAIEEIIQGAVIGKSPLDVMQC